MAGEINIVRYDANEILHGDDLNYGETRTYENLTSIIKRLSISTKDVIIQGGIVKERGTPSMNVDVEAIFAFCVSTGKFAYYGSTFGPVAIANGGAQTRYDLIEVRLKETNFDELQRAYKDPNTGDITYQDWMTKIHYEMEVQIIQGSEGAGVAASHTAGWVKIAEILVDAGETTSILNANIKNATAGYNTETNSTWTAETDATFRSKSLTEIKKILRVKHKEDGDHIDNVIRDAHIDWGAGAGQVDADIMPLGTTIVHAPTGGTSAGLTSASTVRQAVQKILDLLIDLSGVQNGGVLKRHIGNDQVDSEHYVADSIDDEHINWGEVAGQVDADLMPLGTGITHNPTGGSPANLISTSLVRAAIQKILNLLIDLSGVQNDAVLSRHINADAVLNEHIGPLAVRQTEIDLGIDAGDVDADVLPLGTAVTSTPTGGTATNLANNTFVRAAVQETLNRLRDLSGVENGAVDSRHIGNDQVDSQHYVANSIDDEHVADDQLDSRHYKADSIDDEHVNWGTGVNQVSAVDMPIADTGARIIATQLEAATQELALLSKSFLAIALTNYTGLGQPAIAAGGRVEINGQIYYSSSEVAITGTTVNSTWYDILLTPSGSTFTASLIARGTGVWSDAKQGLYSGNNRVIACVFKDGSGNFINKNILKIRNRTCEIKMEIGDWNMDVAQTATVVHGLLSIVKIRDMRVIIRRDADSQISTLYTFSLGAAAVCVIRIMAESTGVTLYRDGGGYFDQAGYDSISFNRGWLVLDYEV